MIQKKYLQKDTINSMKSELFLKGPISYIVWEDFINDAVYKKIEDEIISQSFKKVDVHKDEHHRLNKTVLLKGENLYNLFQFFESSSLEKYLSLFVWYSLKKEFYIQESMLQEINWGEKFIWAVAQLYEKWDFFDWHIDGPIEHWAIWAFTYYLGWYTGDWDDSYGWNLQFWQKGTDWNMFAYEQISYKKNTLVLIIASDHAYHRVTPMNKDITRLSIQSTIMKQ